jgi:hypothetical protein
MDQPGNKTVPQRYKVEVRREMVCLEDQEIEMIGLEGDLGRNRDESARVKDTETHTHTHTKIHTTFFYVFIFKLHFYLFLIRRDIHMVDNSRILSISFTRYRQQNPL